MQANGSLKLSLVADRNAANIHGLDATEFPLVLVPDGKNKAVSVDGDALCTAIDQVAFCASADETRMTLGGVFAQFEGSQLTLAAADGFRLAEHTLTLDAPADDDFNIIIPARALSELSRIVKQTSGPVEITVGQNLVFFHIVDADIVLSSQLIEAKFPNYRRIIPAERATRTVINRVVWCAPSCHLAN